MIEPVTIEPDAVYDDAALRQALGLSAATLANARRVGSLRSSRQGKRTLYTGAWVLAWLESDALPDRGVPPRRGPETPRNQAAGREGGR